ncbi:MAG: hypothetical protein ACT4PM_14825 [Gemmatimonadales bacterium]
MGAIAVLLEGRAYPPSLRRSPQSHLRFHRCRSAQDLERILQNRLTEAIVLDGRSARAVELETLRSHYPGIPIVIMGRLRPEEAGLLLRWDELGVATVLVDGIDDAVAGDLVLRQTVSRRRLAALAEYPRLLRLSERLQLRAWDRLVGDADYPPSPRELARALEVSREHLSRQFAAGGAPTLKQVADLVRVVTALFLLQNPAYDTRTVARLLGLASVSHLHLVVRRVTGIKLREARALTPREVLRRFLRTRRIGPTA